MPVLRPQPVPGKADGATRWPTLQPVHTPLHASWLNQIKIYCAGKRRRAPLGPFNQRDGISDTCGTVTIIIMMAMIVLRYLYMLALVAWLGGMLALVGLTAPSIFAVLDHQDAAGGRLLADAIAEDIGRRFRMVAYMCGSVMLATLVGMRLLGPRPLHFAARFATVVGMFALAAYSGLSVPNQIGRRPTAFMIISMIGGLSLLYWEARE